MNLKLTSIMLFVLLAFHLHLLEDIAGSKGPDGFWSIPYFLPISHWTYTWIGAKSSTLGVKDQPTLSLPKCSPGGMRRGHLGKALVGATG